MSSFTTRDGTQIHYKDRGSGPAVTFSHTEFTDDLKQLDVPTQLLHGTADRIVPIEISAMRAAPLIENAKTLYCAAASHGLASSLSN